MLKKKGYLPALLWKRIVAFVVDLIVLDLFILSAFEDAVKEHLPNLSISTAVTGSVVITKDLVFLITAIGIFALLYFAILEYKLGQTIGTIFMNLHVVGAEGTLTFAQCILRNLYAIPVFPFILFWIADPLYMFFDANNQRLLERWSKTMTVQILPPAWAKVRYNEIPTE